MAKRAPTRGAASAGSPESRTLLARAARMYYLDHATQAEIATALGTSRPTVSRLLADARAAGIVRIEIHDDPPDPSGELTGRLQEALSLRGVHLAPDAQSPYLGQALAPGVAAALKETSLSAGDVLLVSSGATIYEVAQHELPSLPGVVVAPTVGGVDEPEAYYQTNELARSIAARINGIPQFLYAPAMPSAALHPALLEDPLISRITSHWAEAEAALLGIGAPPVTRSSTPAWFPHDSALLHQAVGDICERPYTADGEPLSIPGTERLIAMDLHHLRAVPHTIGVAVGAVKIPSILAAVRAGYVNTLVTDVTTAQLLCDAAGAASSPDPGTRS